MPIASDDGDWLASLARQSASSDGKERPGNTSKRKRKGGGNNAGNKSSRRCDDANTSPASKAQRIERREQKREDRKERKRLVEEARQQRLAKKRQKLNRGPMPSLTAKKVSSRGQRQGMTALSKRALAQISTTMSSTMESHLQQFTSSNQQTKRKKNKQQDGASDRQEESFINGLPAEPKGKATKRGTLRPESKELQPRIRDYNGQGLVRNSLYLSFNDPSFVPKLEEEFEEHIPGFFGKAKQKAAKKQADKDMLWRKCLKAKEEGENGMGMKGGTKRK